jgi:hypothetical protein
MANLLTAAERVSYENQVEAAEQGGSERELGETSAKALIAGFHHVTFPTVTAYGLRKEELLEKLNPQAKAAANAVLVAYRSTVAQEEKEGK